MAAGEMYLAHTGTKVTCGAVREYGDTIREWIDAGIFDAASVAVTQTACHMVSPHSGAGRSETAPYGRWW